MARSVMGFMVSIFFNYGALAALVSVFLYLPGSTQ